MRAFAWFARGSKLNYEIIVVEDSSPDGTLAVAEKLRDTYGPEHIKILSRQGKLGLGSAYVDGLKLVKGNYVIILDADMSHHVRSTCTTPRRVVKMRSHPRLLRAHSLNSLPT